MSGAKIFKLHRYLIYIKLLSLTIYFRKCSIKLNLCGMQANGYHYYLISQIIKLEINCTRLLR